ncbi:kunitz-type serine protease inhibitor Kunitz-1 isoform X2 [Austrofundulus limnaeus]|nr:PREDICTED: kunitz-type serine protease inhibitor Kunitz-1-like isoform X2 [Austrofundulus limnaeus]XP_013859098.1 PREDICTED: kunitz-type serine protease inhibitor Kunitz-1-like isoform X2 [Austrofundulus limnaeus]
MKNLLVLGIVLSALHIIYSKTPAFCQKPSDPGQGTKYIFAVYYDASNDRCNPFFYGGEGGNENRFENERQCMRNCSPNAENIYPVDESKACLLKHETGTCSGSLLKYYYNPAHDKCKKFIWTGCHGNGNRFSDSETCNSTCLGIHQDSDELEEDEPDTPIAIICGVLLAIIIVAIIVTVTVLTVQSKKKKGSKKTSKNKSSDSQPDSPLQERAIEMA